jgi:hypothetical protein
MTQSGLRWFSVRLIIECSTNVEGISHKLFEDKIVLVRASNEEEARVKAHDLEGSGPHEYINGEGNRVLCRFYEILDVAEILDEVIAEGTEVYYSFLRAEELAIIRAILQSKI